MIQATRTSVILPRGNREMLESEPLSLRAWHRYHPRVHRSDMKALLQRKGGWAVQDGPHATKWVLPLVKCPPKYLADYGYEMVVQGKTVEFRKAADGGGSIWTTDGDQPVSDRRQCGRRQCG